MSPKAVLTYLMAHLSYTGGSGSILREEWTSRDGDRASATTHPGELPQSAAGHKALSGRLMHLISDVSDVILPVNNEQRPATG